MPQSTSGARGGRTRPIPRLPIPRRALIRSHPGTGASLCFIGHILMENRNGLIVQTEMTQADNHAERRAALAMIHRHSPGSTRRLTVGADKGYDCTDFVNDLRQACVTPHVAQKVRHSAIDGRTTRHSGYAILQKRRKKIEEPFGWPRRSDPWRRQFFGASNGWVPSSPLRWRPAILPGCPGCWQHEPASEDRFRPATATNPPN